MTIDYESTAREYLDREGLPNGADAVAALVYTLEATFDAGRTGGTFSQSVASEFLAELGAPYTAYDLAQCELMVMATFEAGRV